MCVGKPNINCVYTSKKQQTKKVHRWRAKFSKRFSAVSLEILALPTYTRVSLFKKI